MPRTHCGVVPGSPCPRLSIPPSCLPSGGRQKPVMSSCPSPSPLRLSFKTKSREEKSCKDKSIPDVGHAKVQSRPLSRLCTRQPANAHLCRCASACTACLQQRPPVHQDEQNADDPGRPGSRTERGKAQDPG